MHINTAFSGFSVNDLEAAKHFYQTVIGLSVTADDRGLHLSLPKGGEVFVYSKPNHQPASFTILNFLVNDIDAAVDQLMEQGVDLEHYEGMNQDDKGIARAETGKGPSIAWFKDPAGNILAVIQDESHQND